MPPCCRVSIISPYKSSRISPKCTDSSTAEQLGITELVSSETSYFYGSSRGTHPEYPGRFCSIPRAFDRTWRNLLDGRCHGRCQPGQRFCRSAHHLRRADHQRCGGGVCQVSTTLFRTVFFGGYPVVERYSHAYRVSYYEQTASGAVDTNLAGLDATVYFPLVDFKFTNDTPYWILMETYVNVRGTLAHLEVVFDQRWPQRHLGNNRPTNVVPAPKPLFEENDELKAGQIRAGRLGCQRRGRDTSHARYEERRGLFH